MSAFDGPIHVPVAPSRALLRGMLAAHAGAAALLALALPWSRGLALLAALVIGNAVRVGYRLTHRRADDVAAVLLGSDDTWVATLVDARTVRARLSGPPFVSVRLTAFSLRCDDGRVRSVVLLGDNAPPQVCRRLRVRLLHGRGGWS